jgi:hypothetical protein
VNDSAGVRVGLQLSILNLMRTFLMKSGWFKKFFVVLDPDGCHGQGSWLLVGSVYQITLKES